MGTSRLTWNVAGRARLENGWYSKRRGGRRGWGKRTKSAWLDAGKLALSCPIWRRRAWPKTPYDFANWPCGRCKSPVASRFDPLQGQGVSLVSGNSRSLRSVWSEIGLEKPADQQDCCSQVARYLLVLTMIVVYFGNFASESRILKRLSTNSTEIYSSNFTYTILIWNRILFVVYQYVWLELIVRRIINAKNDSNLSRFRFIDISHNVVLLHEALLCHRRMTFSRLLMPGSVVSRWKHSNAQKIAASYQRAHYGMIIQLWWDWCEFL